MKQLPWLVTLGSLICGTPTLAQERRAEVSMVTGWALSEGVDGVPVTASDNVFDRGDPKSALAWGVSGGVLVLGGVEAGFRFGQQRSTLEVSGTSSVDVGDMTVNTYHGYLAYNFRGRDATVRPYFMVGLGVTHFSSVASTQGDGHPGKIDGVARFSSTWGTGVKYYVTPSVGLRFGVQWTPTFIESATQGWWCGPLWGCYGQFSNQVDFNGGITFRF